MFKRVFVGPISVLIFGSFIFAQAPGGRGAIPNATPEQTAAIAQMNVDLAPATQALTVARNAVVAAALAVPRDDAGIRTKVDAVKAAELTLANSRTDAFFENPGFIE